MALFPIQYFIQHSILLDYIAKLVRRVRSIAPSCLIYVIDNPPHCQRRANLE